MAIGVDHRSAQPDRGTGHPGPTRVPGRRAAPRLRLRRRLAGARAPHRRARGRGHLGRGRRPAPGASRSSRRPWTPSSTSARRPSCAASAAWPSSTSRASRPATRNRRRSSSGSPRRPPRRSRSASRRAYEPPIREELVARRIARAPCRRLAGRRLGHAGLGAQRWGPFCAEQGADVFLVQSQVSSAQHLAAGYEPLELSRLHAAHGHPGGGRQHDLVRGGAASSWSRASPPSSWASGPARPARRARCWASACPR